jgi:DNA-3-methyladenine glycosylase II
MVGSAIAITSFPSDERCRASVTRESESTDTLLGAHVGRTSPDSAGDHNHRSRDGCQGRLPERHDLLEGVMTSPKRLDVRPGLAWLRRADPVLARVMDKHPGFDPNAWMHGLPPLDLFGALVFQVIGQQISVLAATAIFARVVERFGGRAPDPDDLAALDPDTLRKLGLSRQKANTVLKLAQHFRDGRLSEAELRNLPDDEAIRQLTAVKGVGPWTAKGALLIALRRPDLVRTDDVALRHAIQASYGLDHLPAPDEVAALARRWSPYGSLASSLLLAAARSK